MSVQPKNQFIVPGTKPVHRPGCPKCQGRNFGGLMTAGVLTFTCRDCGNQWAGGVGQVPLDPRDPIPPEDPRTRPPLEFTKTKESGDKLVPVQVRRIDPTPEYRKGAPLPPPGESDEG